MKYTLKNLETPEVKRLLALIFSEPGVGKTLLGATFPKPVFIALEDGTETVAGSDAQVLKAESSQDLIDAVTFACNEVDCDTIIIDTISKLDQIIDLETLASCPQGRKSMGMAHGGFHNAYNVSALRHGEIVKFLGEVRDHAGKHVIMLSHSTHEHVSEPDQEDYDAFTIDVHKKSAPHYKRECNLIGHLRVKSTLVGAEGERKRAKGQGQRELICHAQPSSITKNRYFIDKAMPVKLGENPLYEHVSTLVQR